MASPAGIRPGTSFPRLASLLARDSYLPRQLAHRGDRLVFSNGILLLGVFSCVLIVIFRGSTHALFPLYAVGVFLSFALVFKTGVIVTAVPCHLERSGSGFAPVR